MIKWPILTRIYLHGVLWHIMLLLGAEYLGTICLKLQHRRSLKCSLLHSSLCSITQPAACHTDFKLHRNLSHSSSSCRHSTEPTWYLSSVVYGLPNYYVVKGSRGTQDHCSPNYSRANDLEVKSIRYQQQCASYVPEFLNYWDQLCTSHFLNLTGISKLTVNWSQSCNYRCM